MVASILNFHLYKGEKVMALVPIHFSFHPFMFWWLIL